MEDPEHLIQRRQLIVQKIYQCNDPVILAFLLKLLLYSQNG